MRRILGDRLTAGLLAAMVAYVLLLQGLVSAYAQGALATPQPGSTFVICSLTGTVSGTHDTVDESPLERAAHQCCAALCHAAVSHSPILPASNLGTACVPEADIPFHFQAGHSIRPPSTLGLLPEARAPPFVSI